MWNRLLKADLEHLGQVWSYPLFDQFRAETLVWLGGVVPSPVLFSAPLPCPHLTSFLTVAIFHTFSIQNRFTLS